MSSAVAPSPKFISEEEYLEGERYSEIRHEYIGGQVYAMAGRAMTTIASPETFSASCVNDFAANGANRSWRI